MSLPASVRVRISSETAEAIGLTPVVAQEMPVEELLGHVLGVTGKDVVRIVEILRRGSIVSGASRFRWETLDVLAPELERALDAFPDSDLTRVFDPSKCFVATFRGGARSLVLEREAGEKRRMFRKTSFWDELMNAVHTPQYVEYSYRQRADLYRWRLDASDIDFLRSAARLLAWSSYEAQMRAGVFNSVDLLVRR